MWFGNDSLKVVIYQTVPGEKLIFITGEKEVISECADSMKTDVK